MDVEGELGHGSFRSDGHRRDRSPSASVANTTWWSGTCSQSSPSSVGSDASTVWSAPRRTKRSSPWRVAAMPDPSDASRLSRPSPRPARVVTDVTSPSASPAPDSHASTASANASEVSTAAAASGTSSALPHSSLRARGQSNSRPLRLNSQRPCRNGAAATRRVRCPRSRSGRWPPSPPPGSSARSRRRTGRTRSGGPAGTGPPLRGPRRTSRRRTRRRSPARASGGVAGRTARRSECGASSTSSDSGRGAPR